MNFTKIGKVFTSKFVGTGPSSYKKRIYWTAVSQRLRNTALQCPLVETCYTMKAVQKHILVLENEFILKCWYICVGTN